MSARKKRGASCESGTRRLRAAEREFKKAVGDPYAFAAAIDTAAALMRDVRSRRRHKWGAVSLKQVLRSVAMVLVTHLSSFNYGKQPASAQARVARMLAALAARLAHTVMPKRTR
jgi:Mg-chelatase subunit ChlI